MIRAVVLAAGRGSRLGGVAKALLDDGGRSFLASIAARFTELGVERPIVVVGAPHGERVAAEAGRLGFVIVENPGPDRGMASSVAIGFEALAGQGESALLWPVDIPRVTVATLRTLLTRASCDGVVIPSHEGRGGHPVLVGRDLWPALVACAGEKEGARSVFRHNQDRLVRIAVSDPFVLHDVDDHSDLARLEAAT